MLFRSKAYRDDYGPSRYVEREREEIREVDRMPAVRPRDDRAMPRYAERDERDDHDMARIPRGRSDFDQPSLYERSDRRSYIRQDDGYR